MHQTRTIVPMLLLIMGAGCGGHREAPSANAPQAAALPTMQPKAGGEMVLVPAGRFIMGDAAGRPDVVAQVFGKSPPPPPVIRKRDGTPLVDQSKPFDDKVLDRAVEYVKKKLAGVGAAPVPGRGLLPARVPA